MEKKDNDDIKNIKNKANIYRGFIQSIAIFLSTDIALKIKGFLLLPLMSRIMGPFNVGIWNQISSTTSIASSVAGIGIPAAMIRFLPGSDKDTFKNDYSMSLLLNVSAASILTGLFVIFSSILSEKFFGGSQNRIYLTVGLFLIITGNLKFVLLLFFRIQLISKIYALLNIIESFLGTAVVLIFLILGYNVLGIIVANIIVDCAIIFISLIYIYNKVGFQKPKLDRLKKYFLYGLPTIPLTILNWILNVFDRYLLALYASMKEVGVYSVSYSVTVFIIGVIPSPIWVNLPSIVSKLWNEGKEIEAYTFLRKTYFYQVFLCIPVAFTFIFFGKPFLILMVSNEFQDGFYIVPFVAIAYILYFTNPFYGLILNLFNKTKYTLYVYLASSFSNIILNILLIPKYGIIGAAISTLIALCILILLSMIISMRISKFRYPLVDIFKAAGIALAVYKCISFFFTSSILSFLICSIIACILYFVIAAIFKLLNINEIKRILNFR
ncbi:MAG: oligosaccharide flippase family protein [Clostridia bacterium]|nr:oligosaccharide flippase family protein [Clostridia bacterium]